MTTIPILIGFDAPATVVVEVIVTDWVLDFTVVTRIRRCHLYSLRDALTLHRRCCRFGIPLRYGHCKQRIPPVRFTSCSYRLSLIWNLVPSWPLQIESAHLYDTSHVLTVFSRWWLGAPLHRDFYKQRVPTCTTHRTFLPSSVAADLELDCIVVTAMRR